MVVRIGLFAAVAFVLLLALVGAIWGVHFVLQQLGLPTGDWGHAIFVILLIAIGMGFTQGRSEPDQATVRLVVRASNVKGKQAVTARWCLVNLPYELAKDMELTLSDAEFGNPPVFAAVTVIERLTQPASDGAWVVAELELHDRADFDRLGKSGSWYETRDGLNDAEAAEVTADPRPAGLTRSRQASLPGRRVTVH